MVGVVFVFVSEDANEAEALADAFDNAGYSITGTHAIGEALSVVLWSRAARRSSLFRSAAERALHSGRAVVVSLIAPPDPARVLGAPVIDLSAWEGDDGQALEPLFDAVRDILQPARPSVIALPAFDYEDAEFVECHAPVLSQAERAELAMRAWEAPIPTHMLRPERQPAIQAEEALELAEIAPAPEAPKRRAAPRRAPAEEQLIAEGMARIAAEMANPEGEDEPKRKRGVESPRRDYRRAAPPRDPVSRAPAALALAFVVMVGLSALTTRLNMPSAAVPTDAAHSDSVSLETVTAGASELNDFAPEQRPPMFEPRPYAEPASAPVRRAARRVAPPMQHAEYVPQPKTSWDDEAPAAWSVPELIPAAIVAELERASNAASDAATAVTSAAGAVY